MLFRCNTVKRDYNQGDARHNHQYNSYLSKADYEELERLRIRVAKFKGRNPKDFSKGAFIMWMCRKCTINFDDGIPLEDFCDNQISDIEDAIRSLQNIIKGTDEFKRKSIKEAYGEDEDEQEER